MSRKLDNSPAVIGIDIGKNSFHIVGQNQRGAVVLRQKWSRGQVEARLANLPPCRIGMEACVGAHLYLQRIIKQATLLPARTGGDAIAMFIAEKLEAVANLKQPLVKYVAENPGYRVIDGRFMEIRLAMGVPKGREFAIYYLGVFIAELKASGFVADALERSGQEAAVAPL